MAKIFLDTNYFIDLVERKEEIKVDNFLGHRLYISALSLHILVYVYKYKIPNQALERLMEDINLVNLDTPVSVKALSGPTTDFEDNIQLHSSAAVDAEVFLTSDKKLLKLGFFGKARIESSY